MGWDKRYFNESYINVLVTEYKRYNIPHRLIITDDLTMLLTPKSTFINISYHTSDCDEHDVKKTKEYKRGTVPDHVTTYYRDGKPVTTLYMRPYFRKDYKNSK